MRLMTRTAALAITLATSTAGIAGCSGSSGGSAADGSQTPGATASASAHSSTTAAPTGQALHDPTFNSPAPQQSCNGRLGGSQGNPPRALPALPNTTWDGLDNTNQMYGGWMARTDVATVEQQLSNKFRKAGFQVSAITSPSKYSERFSFRGHKHTGTISAGVLCAGHIKVLYLVDAAAKPNATAATVAPTSSTTP